jgi:SEC-C motif-containing protein
MDCPCCSGLQYAACCQPYHTKAKRALTAEALMRSRYSAYAIPNKAYLMETTYPTQRHHHDASDMEDWGKRNTWLKLEIVDKPAFNKVMFKAFYIDEDGVPQIHHELSTFKLKNKHWYYYTGKQVHS